MIIWYQIKLDLASCLYWKHESFQLVVIFISNQTRNSTLVFSKSRGNYLFSSSNFIPHSSTNFRRSSWNSEGVSTAQEKNHCARLTLWHYSCFTFFHVHDPERPNVFFGELNLSSFFSFSPGCSSHLGWGEEANSRSEETSRTCGQLIGDPEY